MKVTCRECKWQGSVAAGYTYVKKKVKIKDRGVKEMRVRYPREDDKGLPATAISCPNCGKHKLKRS